MLMAARRRRPRFVPVVNAGVMQDQTRLATTFVEEGVVGVARRQNKQRQTMGGSKPYQEVGQQADRTFQLYR